MCGGLAPSLLARGEVAGAEKVLGRDQTLQRGEPVVIVGVAEIGIATRLRRRDLAGEGGGPFAPGEAALA
jgi:hypothetical protein